MLFVFDSCFVAAFSWLGATNMEVSKVPLLDIAAMCLCHHSFVGHYRAMGLMTHLSHMSNGSSQCHHIQQHHYLHHLWKKKWPKTLRKNEVFFFGLLFLRHKCVTFEWVITVPWVCFLWAIRLSEIFWVIIGRWELFCHYYVMNLMCHG